MGYNLFDRPSAVATVAAGTHATQGRKEGSNEKSQAHDDGGASGDPRGPVPRGDGRMG